MATKDVYDENDSRIPKPVIELLTGKKGLFLRQKGKYRECFEMCCGCEMSNRYDVEDLDGNDLLKLKEQSNCCYRQCCGSNTPFEMEFELADGTDLDMTFYKPYRCTDSNACCPCGCWYWCNCGAQMDIIANGDKIGYVEEQYGTWCWKGLWSAFDDEGNERLKMETHCCDFMVCCCCSDIDFDIMDPEDKVIGKLSKKWMCTCCACTQQLDHFQVEFEEDVSAENKLYGLALAILMKYVYFEEAQDLDNPDAAV